MPLPEQNPGICIFFKIPKVIWYATILGNYLGFKLLKDVLPFNLASPIFSTSPLKHNKPLPSNAHTQKWYTYACAITRLLHSLLYELPSQQKTPSPLPLLFYSFTSFYLTVPLVKSHYPFKFQLIVISFVMSNKVAYPISS